jgi:hypothetical protein
MGRLTGTEWLTGIGWSTRTGGSTTMGGSKTRGASLMMGGSRLVGQGDGRMYEIGRGRGRDFSTRGTGSGKRGIAAVTGIRSGGGSGNGSGSKRGISYGRYWCRCLSFSR